MSQKDKVKYRGDNDLEMLGPTLQADNSVVVTGTCVGKLFDPEKETELREAAIATAIILLVKGEPKFLAGETVRLALDDGTFQETTILSVDTGAKTVTLNAPLDDSMAKRRAVDRKLGADVTMTIFNAANASAGNEDYGFRGKILSTHADIVRDMTVRAESRLVDGSGNVIIESKLLEFTDGV